MPARPPAASLACALSSTILALAWGLPAPAGAWERTRDPFTGVCLWSEARELDFWLDEGCDVGGSRAACFEAVASALEVWNRAGCAELRLHLAGTLRGARVESDLDRPENNRRVIRVVGPRGGRAPRRSIPAEELEAGHSIVTYDRVSGRIVDADMLIELDGLDADTLHNIVLHEVGHALGLAHARSPRAVMFPSSPAYPRSEALDADDLAAVCTLYPPGAPTPGCAAAGPIYAQRRWAASLEGDAGCASAGAGGGLGGCLAGLWMVRRARGPRSRPRAGCRSRSGAPPCPRGKTRPG